MNSLGKVFNGTEARGLTLMERRFQVALPRAAYTVPVLRSFLGCALHVHGVCPECQRDILVAASEACANVIDHGAPASDYQVSVSIEQACCVIRITHNGRHFTPTIAPPRPAPDSESGRGIFLMHALMDEVVFDVEPDGRTTVLLVKRLCLLPAAKRPLTPAVASG